MILFTGWLGWSVFVSKIEYDRVVRERKSRGHVVTSRFINEISFLADHRNYASVVRMRAGHQIQTGDGGMEYYAKTQRTIKIIGAVDTAALLGSLEYTST
jgi:hypothetical protein